MRPPVRPRRAALPAGAPAAGLAARLAAGLAAGLAAWLAAGCSITPSLPPDSARGIGAGETRVDAFAVPALGATLTRGVTDKLDVGASAELVGLVSLAAKYTFVDRPEFAAAIEGRGFVGFGEDVAEARGLSLGPVIELGAAPLRLIAGARWNELDHETYTDDLGLDWGEIRPRPGDDYGTIVQAYAMLAFGRTERGHLLLGATCDVYVSLDDGPDRYGDRRHRDPCYPLAGIALTLGRAR